MKSIFTRKFPGLAFVEINISYCPPCKSGICNLVYQIKGDQFFVRWMKPKTGWQFFLILISIWSRHIWIVLCAFFLLLLTCLLLYIYKFQPSKVTYIYAWTYILNELLKNFKKKKNASYLIFMVSYSIDTSSSNRGRKSVQAKTMSINWKLRLSYWDAWTNLQGTN